MATSIGPLLSSAGIGSGLDVNSIVSALVNVERVPITRLQTQASTLQTQLSSYGKIQSYVSAVRDAARTLASPATWTQTVGVSSDAAVGISTDGNTLPGSYKVEVQNLAAAQSLATATTYPGATSTLGQGSLHIELGTWAGSAFTAQGGATAIDVTIGPGEDTLQQVRDKINAAGGGVVASILTDATGARLVLRSRDTGAANGFRVGVTESAPAGLAALAYDPSGAATSMTLAQAASDAHATINQLPVTSAGNTLAGVIDGLTLTLNKVTAAPVDVSATPDSASMKKSVEAFVAAYNDMSKYLTEQTKYDAASKTAGTLQGDSAALAVRSQMRSLLATTSGASTTFARLADIGFDVQTDGTINLVGSKLDNALANVVELKKLFANSDSVTPANNGVLAQMRDLADRFLSVDGTLTTRSDGLQHRIEDNKDQQARLEVRVSSFEARVRAQYTALDAQMAQLTGLSTYVTQQMAMLNRSSSGGGD
jgi:flagellar hook-associated protein 2